MDAATDTDTDRTRTGQEPIVRLTPSAADQVRSMQSSQPENAGKHLRVFVEQGGCSGLQYGLTFDQPREGDIIERFFDVQVLVDAVSAQYLQGTVIDFHDTLNDSGFKMSNPKAKENCGCGRSFGT